MSTARILWQLDRRRRRRWWALRFPALMGSPRRFWGVAAAAAAATFLISFAVTGAAVAFAAASSSPDTWWRLVVTAAVIVALLDAARGISAVAGRDAFVDPDVGLLAATGVGGADVVLARLFGRLLLGPAVGLSVVWPGACLGALAAGAGIAEVARSAPVVGLLLFARCLGALLSVAVLRILLMLPKEATGPCVLLGALATPALTTGALVGLTAPVATALDRSSGPASFVSEALDAFPLNSLVDVVLRAAAASTAAWLVACLVVVVAAARLAPARPALVQRHFASGIRYRMGRPLRSRGVLALLDKDVRVLVRRGPSAWQLISDVTMIIPLVGGLALATRALDPGSAASAQFGRALVLMAGVTGLVVVVGIASEALVTLTSVDADGPVVRVLQVQRRLFDRYLALRAVVHSGMLCVAVLAVVLIAGPAAGWTPAMQAARAAAGLAAVAVETVVVVAGSAGRPAFFRPAAGVPALEPSVRLAGGLGSFAVIVVCCPLAAPTAFLPDGYGLLAALLVACSVPAAVVAAARLTPPAYRRSAKGAI
jgi:hypothetical protein